MNPKLYVNLSCWRKYICEYRAGLFYILCLKIWSIHTYNMTCCFTFSFTSDSPLKSDHFVP